MIAIHLSQSPISSFKEGCKLCFFTEPQIEERKKALKTDEDPFSEALRSGAFNGKKNKFLLIYGITPKTSLLLGGLGKNIDPKELRNLVANGIKEYKKTKQQHLYIECPRSEDIPEASIIEPLLEGIYLGNYTFQRKKETTEKVNHKITICQLNSSHSKLLQETKKLCEAVNETRDLVNENADILTPEQLAKKAQETAKKLKMKCSILDEKALQKAGCRLLLAVGQGAKNKPRLIILEHLKGGKNKKTIALFGKGITFDSGGLNLKPSGHIETMKQDMAGAAAVLGTMKAIASLNIKANVIGILPCAENAIGSQAYKPGDIIRAHNGLTVEIGNTDAEGRLVLADALSYIENQYKPDYIIDLATLTGAVLIALGSQYAALLGRNPEFNSQLIEASQITDEKLWELPLTAPYMEEMKSDIADLRNVGKNREAGTIKGAVFLSHFVKTENWAHLDIAGTAWSSERKGYIPKNATGYGVRLLTQLIKNL